MNRINEILCLESSNTHFIRLYREGIFYKAYERSAYAFVTDVQPFMVKKRFMKSAGRAVVSIGFPSEGLHKHFAPERVKKLENGVEIELTQEIDIEAFEAWEKGIALTPEVAKTKVAATTPTTPSANATVMAPPPMASCTEQEAVMKIRMYPIEGKTPLDCMLFLSELKKTL